ncbi:MAG TPA: FAD-dependent oxidoreductase [Kaistia sp.]|nr:FAD-dependent oxidoreductase [Kaistia sp.]
MRVSIVGGGIAGLSLAWALTRRGIDAALFEQGAVPNPRSSSHDEHRITRHSYGGLSGYGAMMPAAFEAYETLFADLGIRHIHPERLVYIGRRASDWPETTARELDTLGIRHRSLSRDVLAAMLPMIRTDDVIEAFEAEGAGELFAGRIVEGLAAWLREAGVTIHEGTRVRAIDPAIGRVVTDGGQFDADLVVVAAGAWVGDLLPELKGRLVPSRQTVLYLEPPQRFAAAWAAAPILVDTGLSHGAYVLPPKAGTRLKIGDHVFTRRGHGDDDRIATEVDIAPVAAAAREAFVDFDHYRLLEAKVCYYTVTEDERFVVEPIGAAGFVVSACSGHGFKLGPLIASRLADAIAGRASIGSVSAYAAGRAPAGP